MEKGMRVAFAASMVAALLISADALAQTRNLAKPALKGNISLEEALAKRASVREFDDEPLDVKQVAQLLWAAQGVTRGDEKRTAPSAGALYPLIVYVVAGDVKGLSPGVYRYNPHRHALTKVKGADQRPKLARAAKGQSSVKQAPVSFVVAVNYSRMARYDERGRMYADIEQGHAAQNILLQATAMGLGAVPVGAMDAGEVGKILDLPQELSAEYIVPIGFPD